MMNTVLYFAYGSNLDEAQMHARCPGARRDTRATLPGHALAFGGFSHRWGGAVASVVRERGRDVAGLLYAVPREEVALLDRFEGSPYAYERLLRIVVDERGRRRRAQLYVQHEADFVRWTPAPAYFAATHRAYLRLGFDRRSLLHAIAGGSS
jgi:cation transport regulator ChaC